MNILSPVPIFRIFDEQKAVEFYVEFLGFEKIWEHRFSDDAPIYMQVSRGDCHLHLSEHHGDSTPGSSIRVSVSDIDAFYQEISAKKYKYARPGVEKMPWGTRDMTISDPFGNKVIFTDDGV